ncbi:MAG: hypothetical protein GY953_17080, partial [bacterium]|nr:hypothetical protein [bacterium]
MIDGILAAGMTDAIKSSLLVLLPLGGSVMLAFGVYQVVTDLRTSTRKRVIDRLKGDGMDPSKGHGDAINFEDFRRQSGEVTGLLARSFSKLSFTSSLQRVLEQANINWRAAQVLVNLTAIASILGAVLLV